MARLQRITPLDMPVHIIQRGNNRQACFISDEDYGAYVGWLKDYSMKYQVDIHAWVMMTNHVHLLCTPRQKGWHKSNDAVPGSEDMSNTSIMSTGAVEHCGKDALNPA